MTIGSARTSNRGIRLGADAVRSVGRISSWSILLSVFALIALAPTLLIFTWLAARATTAIETMMTAAASVVVLTSLIPVGLTIRMGSQFRAMASSPALASLVKPLESLRVVMGWLAAIAGVGQVFVVGALLLNVTSPEVIATIGKSKEEITVERMREIAAALDDYARTNQRFPDARSYEELRMRLSSTEEEENALAGTDGWDRPFIYTAAQHNAIGSTYTLLSLGGDGVKQDSSETSLRRGGKRTPAEIEGRDVQIDSGVFVLGPENVLGPALRPEAEK